MQPQRRIRVVYLDHVARLSGGELALLRTLPALLEHVDPLVVLAEDGPLVSRLEEAGVAVQVLPLREDVRETRRTNVVAGALRLASVVELGRYVLQLRRLIRASGAQIVHTNSLKAAIYGGIAGRLAGVPVLWHVRDRIAPDYLPRPVVALVRALSRVLPSAVVANSAATLATLPSMSARSVIGSPVVPDAVLSPAVATRRDGPLTVGIVGRLALWKGQQVFLEAFAAAFRGTDARARIIGSAMFGEDDYAAALEEQARSLDIERQVDFRGFREDVWKEMAELDILVHCSTVPEPFGQVVIEGMAAGLAVIASAEGGPGEIVNNGVDGILIPPRDPALLADALRRVAGSADFRASLGSAGRQTALLYSPARSAEALLRVYRALLQL